MTGCPPSVVLLSLRSSLWGPMARDNEVSLETSPPWLSLPSAMRRREGRVIGYCGRASIELKVESIKLWVAPESTRATVSSQPIAVLTLTASEKCRFGEERLFE